MEVLKRGLNGWKEKKVLKEEKKSTKILEKVIEKEAEKEAQKIIDIKAIANDLALNIIKANKETNLYINQKGKVKEGLINIKGLKQLTSALKDIQEILINNPQIYELKKEKLELEKRKEEKENW